MRAPAFDFWDSALGRFVNEVPCARHVHAGVTIFELVREDTGKPRYDVPRFYVRGLGRFETRLAAEMAIDGKLAPKGAAPAAKPARLRVGKR